jgi:hypothetical protein
MSFTIHSALEQFNEVRNTLKMTTGSADLDSLIDSIQEGLFYLFYGNNHVALDTLVYTFLVNCILPIKQRHGFDKKFNGLLHDVHPWISYQYYIYSFPKSYSAVISCLLLVHSFLAWLN